MTITHVSSLSELNKLLGSPNKLTVIDFHATYVSKKTVDSLHSKDVHWGFSGYRWCGPCKMIAPTFEKLAQQYAGKVNFVKVDVDEAQEVAQKYSVTAMPTFIFLKGSDVVHTIRGARNACVVFSQPYHDIHEATQSSELTNAVERYSGGGGAAAFQGTGHKLGDGTPNAKFTDPRGKFEFNSEIKVVAGLVAAYLFLMYMSS
ncbi:SubName: Full=Related to TRX2-thioredoxin II {ECO:0000313/EMBL:CCA74139.1} [Serendipita indica DSM 11827]|nr:SubName: Full=Related to TRX2-thioredoxin II {ECO:0000313/EMBL:CCA74139.1} [Serendipita indica DSM 11827]